MKLSVIGAGGVRSPFLARSIANRADELNIDELVFMDIDAEKLMIYGALAKKIASILCPSLKFILTTNAHEAISGADYIITTIRAGGDEMRVRDERIALNLGVLGQETTGAAGFSFAMRSVPALINYCELTKQYANKNCKVFNFTNPVGVVSQALCDMGYDFTYGICDAPSGMLRTFEKLYNAKEGSIKGEIYGLNHLSYFSSIKLDGHEILHELIRNDDAYKKTDLRYFDKSLLKERSAVLNEYLYYYYYSEKALRNVLHAKQIRSEQILEINKNMMSELKLANTFEKSLYIFEKWYGERENNYMASETGVKRSTPWHFDVFDKDDGGYAGVALKFIEIEKSGKEDDMILCTQNGGAIPNMLPADVVEITCQVSKSGVTPHKFENVDEQNLELIRRVKVYERLASAAIREKSKQKAIEALTLHPLINSYSLAKSLIDEYLKLNKEFTGGWK